MLKKIAHWYLKTIETICVFLLLLILACMCLQIICRIFTIGQNFTEELSRLSFSLLIFLGAPLVMAEGADIAVDMLVNNLPYAVKKYTNIFVNFLIVIFCIFCIRSLITFIGSNAGVTAVSLTWVKMNWLYSLFLFSFFCLLITTIVKVIAAFKGKKQTLDIHEREISEKEVDLGL